MAHRAIKAAAIRTGNTVKAPQVDMAQNSAITDTIKASKSRANEVTGMFVSFWLSMTQVRDNIKGKGSKLSVFAGPICKARKFI